MALLFRVSLVYTKTRSYLAYTMQTLGVNRELLLLDTQCFPDFSPLRVMSTQISSKNLFSQLRKLFAAPIFEDRAKTRAARWTSLLIWTTLSVLTILILSLPFSQMPAETRLKLAVADSVTFLILLIPAILLRRRHVTAAAWFILLVFFAGLIGANFFIFQTVRTPIVIGYVLVIPMAGLMLGRKAMYFFVTVSCIALFTIFSLEGSGVLKPVFGLQAKFLDLATPLAAVGVYMFFLATLIRDIEEGSIEERRFAVAYAESNR